jgi:hypothetical protein
MVTPECNQLHTIRTVRDHDEPVAVLAETHQRRRCTGAGAELDRVHPVARVVWRTPSAIGRVVGQLGLVDAQLLETAFLIWSTFVYFWSSTLASNSGGMTLMPGDVMRATSLNPPLETSIYVAPSSVIDALRHAHHNSISQDHKVLVKPVTLRSIVPHSSTPQE